MGVSTSSPQGPLDLSRLPREVRLIVFDHLYALDSDGFPTVDRLHESCLPRPPDLARKLWSFTVKAPPPFTDSINLPRLDHKLRDELLLHSCHMVEHHIALPSVSSALWTLTHPYRNRLRFLTIHADTLSDAREINKELGALFSLMKGCPHNVSLARLRIKILATQTHLVLDQLCNHIASLFASRPQEVPLQILELDNSFGHLVMPRAYLNGTNLRVQNQGMCMTLLEETLDRPDHILERLPGGRDRWSCNFSFQEDEQELRLKFAIRD